jgi:hypothetical protein
LAYQESIYSHPAHSPSLYQIRYINTSRMTFVNVSTETVVPSTGMNSASYIKYKKLTTYLTNLHHHLVFMMDLNMFCKNHWKIIQIMHMSHVKHLGGSYLCQMGSNTPLSCFNGPKLMMDSYFKTVHNPLLPSVIHPPPSISYPQLTTQ